MQPAPTVPPAEDQGPSRSHARRRSRRTRQRNQPILRTTAPPPTPTSPPDHDAPNTNHSHDHNAPNTNQSHRPQLPSIPAAPPPEQPTTTTQAPSDSTIPAGPEANATASAKRSQQGEDSDLPRPDPAGTPEARRQWRHRARFVAVDAGLRSPRTGYIVELEDAEALDDVVSELEDDGIQITKQRFDGGMVGLTASLDEAAAEEMRTLPGVRTVERDELVELSGVQNGATWGLDRIDQRALPLDSVLVRAHGRRRRRLRDRLGHPPDARRLQRSYQAWCIHRLR